MTFTKPLSVIFSSGITGSARNESVINGSLNLHLISFAFLLKIFIPFMTLSASSDIRPAIFKGNGYVSYERDTKLYHNFFGHLKLNDTLNKLHS